MENWNLILNYSFGISSFVLMILGLFSAVISYSIHRTMKMFSFAFFGILAVCAASTLVEMVADTHGGLPGLLRAAMFLESFFPSFLMPLLTLFLLYASGENWRRSRLFLLTGILWIVYVLLLVVTQFTTAIYVISADGHYSRGPLYPLLLVPPVLLMVFNLLGLLHRWNRLNPKHRLAFLGILILPIIAMLIQMQFYGLYLVGFATSLSALGIFVFFLMEQANQAARQVEENARQELNIKVLQMRPHFIYNVLISIYYLIDADPEKAKQAVHNFTIYLQKNFNSIVQQDLVPFSEELEHTQTYLEVEKMRFSDRLRVTYDIGYETFRLPPLTLQPIVENAVKHGVDPEQKPLQITVRTHKTDHKIEIAVEDTGPGFSTEPGNNGIGLESTRERLKRFCNGSLEIIPRDEGGTIVKISIPDSGGRE